MGECGAAEEVAAGPTAHHREGVEEARNLKRRSELRLGVNQCHHQGEAIEMEQQVTSVLGQGNRLTTQGMRAQPRFRKDRTGMCAGTC